MRVLFSTVYYGYLNRCRFYYEPEHGDNEFWLDFTEMETYPKCAVVNMDDQYYWYDRII